MEQLISLYEKWIHIPRWQKWIILILISVLLFLFIYYSQTVPLQQELNRKRQQIESLTITINRLRVVKKRKALLMKELDQLNNQIKQIESKLPTGKEDVSQIIKSITDADSGMIIESIERKVPKKHKYYVEYPYTVRLIGNYPSFIKWCERLSKANRIINFGDMKIQSIYSSRSSRGKSQNLIPKNATIKVTLQIKAFTLME